MSGTPVGTVMDTPTVPGWMQPEALALPLGPEHNSEAISGGTREPLQYCAAKPGLAELFELP